MLAKVGKVRGSAQRVADAVVTLNARRPPGVEKELRRGWDNYLSRWALSAGAVIALVTFGNLWWSIWVGVIAGSLVALAGFLWFVNSSRYVRDIWTLQEELARIENEESRLHFSHRIDIIAALRDIDRSWGMACLTLSAGIFGLTLLTAMLVGL